MPIEMRGEKPGLRRDLPASGEHTTDVLSEIGYDAAAIAGLEAAGVVSFGDRDAVSDVKGMPRVG